MLKQEYAILLIILIILNMIPDFQKKQNWLKKFFFDKLNKSEIR